MIIIMSTVPLFNLSKATAPTFNLTKAIEEAGKVVPATLMFGAGWSTPTDEDSLDVDLSINIEGVYDVLV